MGLNFILSGFSDNAVTTLGLYYKWQTFFFIPLGALQTCIVPILSYNYAARSSVRIRSTLRISLVWGMALMAFGTLCFECIPRIMLSAFTQNQAVLSIGTTGFRIIGIGFLPMVTSLIFPVFFQAVNRPAESALLTVIRTKLFFVPLGYLFSRYGLSFFWLTFPVTELITSCVGFVFYRRFCRKFLPDVSE